MQLVSTRIWTRVSVSISRTVTIIPRAPPLILTVIMCKKNNWLHGVGNIWDVVSDWQNLRRKSINFIICFYCIRKNITRLFFNVSFFFLFCQIWLKVIFTETLCNRFWLFNILPHHRYFLPQIGLVYCYTRVRLDIMKMFSICLKFGFINLNN